VLHRCDCVCSPTQSLPLPNGCGESHLRRLVVVPPPQVLLHATHSLQADHCPSTLYSVVVVVLVVVVVVVVVLSGLGLVVVVFSGLGLVVVVVLPGLGLVVVVFSGLGLVVVVVLPGLFVVVVTSRQFGGLKVRAHVTLSSWQIPISPLGMAHLCPHSQP